MSDRPSDPTTSANDLPEALDPRRNAHIAELQRLMGRGMDVEAFMASDMGRYIQRRASEEIETAQEKLVEVDAADITTIRALQLDARVAQRVLTYFGDMVKEAEAAEAQHKATYAAEQFPD